MLILTPHRNLNFWHLPKQPQNLRRLSDGNDNNHDSNNENNNDNNGNSSDSNGGDGGGHNGNGYGSSCVSITKCNWPECKERNLNASDCKALIEAEAAACNENIHVIVSKPLKHGDRGYNFFRILADANGMVTNPNGLVYYYLSVWRGVSQLGYRSIGPWDCSGMTARDCCASIKAEVSDRDIDGNYLECRILGPDAQGPSGSPGGPDGSSGGVLNCHNEHGGKQLNRVYIYEDEEGSVHKDPCRG